MSTRSRASPWFREPLEAYAEQVCYFEAYRPTVKNISLDSWRDWLLGVGYPRGHHVMRLGALPGWWAPLTGWDANGSPA